MKSLNVALLVLVPVLVVGCMGGSASSRALYASCDQMKILRDYGALPVLVADQEALRAELTEVIYAEVVSGSSDSSVGVFDSTNLTPCDY